MQAYEGFEFLWARSVLALYSYHQLLASVSFTRFLEKGFGSVR
jgi:hypothetical protein